MASVFPVNNTIVEENPRGTVLMFAIVKLLSGEPLKAQTTATLKFYDFLDTYFRSLKVNEEEILKQIKEDLSSFTRKEKLSDEDERIVLNVLKWMREFHPMEKDCVRLIVDKSMKGTLKLKVNVLENERIPVFSRVSNEILDYVGKVGYNNFKKQEMIGSTISAVHGKKQLFSVLINNSQIRDVLYMLTLLGKASVSEDGNEIIIKNNGKVKMDLCMIGVFTEFMPELNIKPTDYNKRVIDEYLSKI
jgi:hypothetical protein